MEEIAAEANTLASKSSWTGPITDTHSFGGITLIAASDYARAFVEAIGGSPTPVFAHLVVARSVFESSVVSAWLNDPTVNPVERVKRGLCEQLYSAMELVRLGIEDDAAERVARWKAVAAEFGWETRRNRDKPVVDTTERPSVPRGIDKLLVGEGDWRIGRAQWSYLSAVSHVTWWGLRQSVVEPPSDPGVSGLSLAGVGTTAASVFSQAVCVVRAVRKAASARFALMGWEDTEWNAASSEAEVYERAVISSFRPVVG
jgi:hypothetical protein